MTRAGRAGERIVCRCCGIEGARASRGLRATCYERHRLARTLTTFPAVGTPNRSGMTALTDDRLTVWHRMMRTPGRTTADVAAMLDMKPESLERLIARWRVLGDSRAIHTSNYRTQVGVSTDRQRRYRANRRLRHVADAREET